MEDPIRGLYRFETDFPCDYVPVKEAAPEIPFKVYPNPVSESVTIELSAKGSSIRSIVVSNLSGRTWLEVQQVGRKKYEAGLAQLPPGVYFIRVEDERGRRGVESIIKH